MQEFSLFFTGCTHVEAPTALTREEEKNVARLSPNSTKMSSTDGLAELLAKSGMSTPTQISPVAPASPHLSLSSPLHSVS
jgi:hypothetical protein